MILRTRWVFSAVMLLATAAQAEMRAPDLAGRSPDLRQDLMPDLVQGLMQVSDFVEPYAERPTPPRYGTPLLPPHEVYAVLREGGYAPLGRPRLRGNIWSIAAVDRDGDDGRLFIDATNGRILSFMQAGDRLDDETAGTTYDLQSGPPHPPMPPPSMRTFQRPPASIPHVASRAMPVPQPVMPQPPMPKPAPAAARAPAPVQSTAVEAPAQAAAAPGTVGQTRPAAQIQPTQDMPRVQDLE